MACFGASSPTLRFARITKPLAPRMPPLDPEPIAAIRRLREEMAQLRDHQSKALQASMYVGMTREQALDYDNRQQRIFHILRALTLLQGTLNESPSASPSKAASEGDLH